MLRSFIYTVLFLLISLFLYGHESRPLHIKMDVRADKIDYEINVPNTVNTQNLPIISIDSMKLNAHEKWVVLSSGFRQKASVDRDLGSIEGRTLSISYPVFNPVLSTIIILSTNEMEEQILVVPPNKQSITIPKEPNASEVRWQYTVLGMEHIWVGIDHLLFIICLVIITSFSKKLLITITGFTIAHSITLILSALGIIRLPIPPIEAVIALSIVFLCYEIIKHHKDKNSLTYRYPIVVASTFGLLHGLGFAAVLGDIGLPSKHSFEALLFFNIGVEIGQLIFIGIIYLIVILTQRLIKVLFKEQQMSSQVHMSLKIAVYFVGILASYWMFDRII